VSTAPLSLARQYQDSASRRRRSTAPFPSRLFRAVRPLSVSLFSKDGSPVPNPELVPLFLVPHTYENPFLVSFFEVSLLFLALGVRRPLFCSQFYPIRLTSDFERFSEEDPLVPVVFARRLLRFFLGTARFDLRSCQFLQPLIRNVVLSPAGACFSTSPKLLESAATFLPTHNLCRSSLFFRA